MQIDERLLEWATERQVEYIRAVNAAGTVRGAATALGVNKKTIEAAILSATRRAAAAGYAPENDMVRPVPDGFKVKGVSTYYNADGVPSGQWVKSEVDRERQEQLVREAVAALSEEVRGLAPITQPPERNCSEFLAVYPFGDPHVGLYVWSRESGEDFDLEIGRRITLGAVDRLVSSAPPAETAILLLLGDVFHANDQSNLTPGHKHQLDVDSRYVKVLGVGIETYRHAILRALEKHSRVVVKCIPGNHDPQAIWSLAFTLDAYFSAEPRVTVDLGPSKFWYYRFGKVLIGSTHGDTVKQGQLGGIMATDQPRDWGETVHRYWYTGHVHHSSVVELPGVVCESFRTLAARDAYAAGHGYRAGRDMRCIVHHRDYGEVERHRCDVGMIEV